MIKAILMDYAGVVSDTGSLFNELKPFMNISPEELKDIYNVAKLGKISNEEYMSHCSKEGWEWYFKQTKFHNGIQDFFRENKLPVYLVSNHISKLVQSQIDLLNVRDKFKDIFISDKLGLAKPDKKIFDTVLKKINLKPSEVVFIDDQKKNLTTPKEMGIPVIWVNNKTGFGTHGDVVPDAKIYDLSELNELITNMNK
jgi:HAD superfamily hydrolase (TIGR01509 family)